jgi:hypothetical protein
MKKFTIDGEVVIFIVLIIAGAIGTVAMVFADVKENEQCNQSYRACVSNHGADCGKMLEHCK